ALLNSAHTRGEDKCCLFSMEVFERAVLGALREVTPADVLPKKGAGEDPTDGLQKEWGQVEGELAEASAFMEAHGFSVTIGKRITEREVRKKELGAKLLEARSKAAAPAEAAWQEYGSLLDVLERAPDQRDVRLRIRSVLRRMIQQIWFLVVPRGRQRF